ncbi:MAG: sigma-70 family RNA polymerase sigma factor [Candidatus Pacebacteria bacterium]|nr:sigma-70 family RNA polymerase sigma factor [Candidatus Paceibacterota bacterium]
MTEQTDEQLISQYLEGDEKSLEILIKRYLKPIYSFVYKNIGNRAVAEDITQEVFVKVWKNIKRFNKEKKFKNWLFTIAKNSSIDFLRKKKIATVSFNDDLSSEKSGFTEGIEQRETIKEIHNALKKLSPSYQAIVLLKDESNLTFKEIAKELNEPINTIKSRYRRAIFILKDLLYQK